MAVTLADMLEESRGRRTGNLLECAEQGAGLDINQGYPRYSYQANGTTRLPSVAPISMIAYDGCIFQHHLVNFRFATTRHGSENGNYPTSDFLQNGSTGCTISGSNNVVTMSGKQCLVTANYSGGTVDQYGNTVTPASLNYVRVHTLTGGARVGMYAATWDSNRARLGDVNVSYITTGQQDVTTGDVTLIGSYR